jgi:hypothetical protein
VFGKAGLVTVQEAEGGCGGEVGEGFGHAIQRVGGCLGFGFVFEEAGFDGPGAAEAPVGSDHLFDHTELHAIGGLETREVVTQDGFETLRGFIAHDAMFDEQGRG